MDDKDYQELQEFRRKAVLERMRDISESCYCAGWNGGLDHDLYQIVFCGASPEYGMGMVQDLDIHYMRYNAEQSDTWWAWSEESKEPIAISLTEAKTRFQYLDTAGHTVAGVQAQYEANQTIDAWDLIDHERFPQHEWLNYDGHEFRLRSNPAIVLWQRHYSPKYELRCGDTTVAIVAPTWAPAEMRYPDSET